ncbi:hypothetical protein APHAL10511_008515 [Amanita phalloides]|nr:hypothetical protein APHAL10511_008515 [Amanita phalloides]
MSIILPVVAAFFILVVEWFDFAILLTVVDRLYRHIIQIPFHQDITSHEKSIIEAKSFRELCGLNGYTVEEHPVTTKDGFILLLHRVLTKEGNMFNRPVVYLHHGFCMTSEVWVCLTEPSRCLAFVLVEKGYDVWLGNNRGNKYSGRSCHYSNAEAEFWDFSIDDFASKDIPESIAYILNITGLEKLSYIGFSQGSAQAFAALSVDQELKNRINLLIALAPAMSPAIATSSLHGLTTLSPAFAFRIFGRKSFFPPINIFQSTLHPFTFSRAMDAAILWLFGFRSANISVQQKVAAYAHLYSSTSVKVIVHWFQIMRHATFCRYDGRKFPTKSIETPIVLVYGDYDGLLDIDAMLSELPAINIVARRLSGYEHLDILWGNKVDVDVLPLVIEALTEAA